MSDVLHKIGLYKQLIQTNILERIVTKKEGYRCFFVNSRLSVVTYINNNIVEKS